MDSDDGGNDHNASEQYYARKGFPCGDQPRGGAYQSGDRNCLNLVRHGQGGGPGGLEGFLGPVLTEMGEQQATRLAERFATLLCWRWQGVGIDAGSLANRFEHARDVHLGFVRECASNIVEALGVVFSAKSGDAPFACVVGGQC